MCLTEEGTSTDIIHNFKRGRILAGRADFLNVVRQVQKAIGKFIGVATSLTGTRTKNLRQILSDEGEFLAPCQGADLPFPGTNVTQRQQKYGHIDSENSYFTVQKDYINQCKMNYQMSVYAVKGAEKQEWSRDDHLQIVSGRDTLMLEDPQQACGNKRCSRISLQSFHVCS